MGSNLADTGRAQCVLLPAAAAGTSGKLMRAVPGGHGEGLRRYCSDPAGLLLHRANHREHTNRPGPVDAGQASPLGGGRSGPPVLMAVQLRT
jgi:hypothetical protein